jgi:serine/threonine protein kinase
MGNISSSAFAASESYMPGCFPGDPSMRILTRGPLPQGTKRKRDSGSPDKEDLPTAPLPVPKKVRVKPAIPHNSPTTDDEHVIVPKAPVLSIRAREAYTTNEPLKDYERIRKLGESSEGKVYLAKSKKTAELLAVKVLKKKKVYDVAQLPADCMLQINLPMHPFIIFMSQIDIVDGQIWQGLELCNGGDLISFIERVDRNDLKVYKPSPAVRKMFVVHVFVQLGEAFAFLHHGLRRVHKDKWEVDEGWSNAKAIIWGDCKPENLLMNFSPANELSLLPDIRLSDGGHATLASSPWFTAGSPLYFCPEVRMAERGKKGPPMSTKSDIYTMGLTLYFLITRTHWRTGMSPKYLKLPAEYRGLGFTKLLTKCLQVDPKARPSMDFDSASGLAPIIERAYDIRLDLVCKSTTTDRDFWLDWSKEACRKV